MFALCVFVFAQHMLLCLMYNCCACCLSMFVGFVSWFLLFRIGDNALFYYAALVTPLFFPIPFDFNLLSSFSWIFHSSRVCLNMWLPSIPWRQEYAIGCWVRSCSIRALWSCPGQESRAGRITSRRHLLAKPSSRRRCGRLVYFVWSAYVSVDIASTPNRCIFLICMIWLQNTFYLSRAHVCIERASRYVAEFRCVSFMLIYAWLLRRMYWFC